MSGKFSAPKSEYNKDETFASVSVDETCKITFSEAIAKDSDEKYIMVYGYAEAPLVGVEKFGDRMWIYEPQLIKVKLPKKSYETEYNGKKIAAVQSPGMKAAIHLIEQIGYDKPFSGFFDLSIALPVAESIISGKSQDGKDLNAAELDMIGKYFMRIDSVDELKVLKPDTIKDGGSKGGYRGGGGGQKESEKLKERLEFIKAQMLPDSDLAVILTSLDGKLDESLHRGMIHNLINSLFN